MPRVPQPHPLPEGDLSEEQRRLLSILTSGPRAELLAAERSPAGWALPGPFGPMLLSPTVGDPLQELGAAIRYRGGLDAASRELAIVATAFACGCRYELDHHLPLARAAGVPEEALAATAAAMLGGGELDSHRKLQESEDGGHREDGGRHKGGGHPERGASEDGPSEGNGALDAREDVIVRACRQLATAGRLEGGLISVLEAELGRAEAFELLVLAGYYRLLASVLSAYGVD